MELKQIKELMAAMGRSDMKELFIKKGDFELRLERGGPSPYFESPYEHSANFMAQQDYQRSKTLARSGDIPPSLQAPITEEKSETQVGVYIKSPMVGTYYSSPAPEESVFIKVGDVVTKDTVVCIIEAMKVMNEVKAGVSGVVIEILVENGQPVEFGSKLFKVS